MVAKMKLFKNLFKPKWQNNDPSVRKQALISLDKADNQAIFKEVVTSDDSSELRLLALKRITDLDVISQFAQNNTDTKVKELANKLIQQTLSGQIESSLDDDQKIERIQQLDDQKLYEHIAENGNTTSLRKSAVEKISREALLGNLAISDSNSDIRVSAAQKLSQKSTLERVFRATKTKDKNVSRIVKERLDQLIQEAEKPAKLLATQKQICLNIENLGSKGLWQRDKIQFDNYIQQWADLETTETLELQSRFEQAKNQFSNAYNEYLERHEERLKEEAAYLPIKAAKQSIINQLHELLLQLEKNQNLSDSELTNISKTTNDQESNWHSLQTLPKDIEEEILAQFEDALKTIKKDIKDRLHNKTLLDSLEKLNKEISYHVKHPFKLTENALKKFENKISSYTSNELNKEVTKLKQDIKNKLNQASSIAEKQKSRIESLASESKTQLDEIEKHLSNGILKEATQLRKTVQGNIKEMEKYGAKSLHQLHDRLNNVSKQINELSNWRSWANTPQKEQLIQKVETLIDSDIDPKEIAYLISQARNDWKKLGPSEKDSSQDLWEKFQAACDQAYEPCKEHFSNEAKLFEENYEKRLKFLEDLESFLNQANWDTIDWKKVETLFRHSRTEWQDLGLIDKKKRKELNKRFYASFNQLKTTLNTEWNKNAEIKSAIVIEAQALAAVENLQEAIDAAKSLQQRWKKAGRIQHTKERELWSQFKLASDAVFARREDASKQREAEAEQQVTQKDAVIKKIEDFCNQTPTEIGNSKSTFNQLQIDLKSFGKTNQKADEAFDKRLSDALHLYERKIESLDKQQIVNDLQRLKQKSEICSSLENAINTKQEINIDDFTEKMKAVEQPNQNDWNQRINQRFQNLIQLAQQDNPTELLSREAEKTRENKNLTTVQLEIIADIETPENASSERLKAQTQRLSDKLQNHSEENHWDSFLAAEVNWLTTGPVLSKDSSTLNQRHAEAINALKSEYPEELKDY